MSDDADHTDRRHDDTADPEQVLRRAIKRLRDGAERSRARRALDEINGWLDHAAGLIDWGNRRTSELRQALQAAKRGDVTREMTSQITPYQVWVYLMRSPVWGFVEEDGSGISFWRHVESGREVAVANKRGLGWTPETALRTISQAEDYAGETELWLEMRRIG